MSQASESIARQMAVGANVAKIWGDVLFNVKDTTYAGGAKGNGTTDDTASIQATIDYAISVGGKAVFFPHGVYKVTALTGLSSVVLFGDNASFVGISNTVNQLGNAVSQLSKLTDIDMTVPPTNGQYLAYDTPSTKWKPISPFVYNVKDYGAKGDGSTNDAGTIQSAVTAATTSGGIIYFQPGTYKISTALTVPSNITLWFANGAKLSVDTGITVTINGPIEAGLHQIFSGLGSVVGAIKNETLYPQWWGAKGDGATDDAPAINAAITCAQSVGNFLCNRVTFPPAHYMLNSSIIIPHGSEAKRATLIGYNATLRAGTSGMDMIKVVAQGSPASFLNLGETKIFGFRMEGQSVAARGIVIGRDGGSNLYGVDGVFKSLIRDLDIRDCTSAAIEIADSRLWVIDDCTLTTSVVGAVCIYFNSTKDVNMADHWVSKTQMAVASGNTANVCVKMRVTSVAGTSGLGGIHFNDCVFYGQAINCQATNNNSGFADIFINNCAVDGHGSGMAAGYYGWYFSSFQANKSSIVLMNNTWTNAQGIGIYFSNLNACQVLGGKVSSTFYSGIQVDSCNDTKVQSVSLHDVNTNNNGGGALNVSGTGARNKIIGNNIFNAATHNIQIILIASTQTKFVVTSNSTDSGTCVTNNATGTEGTSFVTTGNLS